MNIVKLFNVFCIFLLFSCENVQEQKNSGCKQIVFNKSNAIDINDTTLINRNSRIINLEFNDECMIKGMPCFEFAKNNFYVYSRGANNVSRFDGNGKFLNTIGKIGKGPNEYTELEDVSVNDNIYFLTTQSVIEFNKNGNVVSSYKPEISAFSFCISSDNSKWYFTGNREYGKNRLFCIKNNTKKGYLPCDTKMLSMQEDNFSKCDYILFCEAFNSVIYKIEDNKFNSVYNIDLGSLAIPKAMKKLEDSKLYPKLMKMNFATIKSSYENDKYLVVELYEQVVNKKPNFYYVILNKVQNAVKVFKVDSPNEDTYLLNPQYIDDENIYFIGYYNNRELQEDKNPSIVGINIKSWFNKK